MQVVGEKMDIRRNGQSMEMESPSGEICQVLSTSTHVAINGADGCRVDKTAAPLHTLRNRYGTEYLYFPTGLTPAVHQFFTRQGVRVRLLGEAQAALPAPDLCLVAGFDEADLDLVELVAGHERALIRYPNGVDPARLIAQLARAWPEARVVITAVRHDDVFALARALRNYGLKVSAIIPGSVPETVERLVVTTYAGLAESAQYRGSSFSCFDVSHLDMIIALDALEATGRIPVECLSYALRARLYGLLPLDVEPAPLERDWMAALFGFEELVIPRYGCHERLVQIATRPVTSASH